MKNLFFILFLISSISLPQWKDVSVKTGKSSFNSICKNFVVGDYGVVFHFFYNTHMGYLKEVQNSKVSVNLNSVFSPDKNNAWAVGDSGTIISTTDAGLNWSKTEKVTTEKLNCVFLDTLKTNGWIVGDGGTILKSTDYGINWKKINFVRGISLKSVFFIDSLVGFIVGENGIIMKTADGGKIWKIIKSSTTNSLNSVHFISPSTGFIVGNNGTLLSTTDCGENWERRGNISSVNFNSFSSLDYSGQKKLYCYIAGDKGEFYESVDTGKTWTKNIKDGIKKEVPVDFDIKSILIFEYLHYSSKTTSLFFAGSNSYLYTDYVSQYQDEISGCFFTSKSEGWAVGNSLNKGYILKTTDGGIEWTQNYSTANGLKGICFTSKNNGWAIGDVGLVLRTTDAGNNWNAERYTDNNLNGIAFCDSLNGLIVGDCGVKLSTTDGGMNWTVSQSSNKSDILHFVHLNSPAESYILGYERVQQQTAFAYYPYILFSSDSGKSWEKVRTFSSGKNSGAYFPTLKKGIITGYDIWYPTHILLRISKTDNTNWLFAADTVIKRTVNAMYFYNSMNGYMVGPGGFCAKSTDGGENWNIISSGTNKELKTLFFFDENNGWATGQNGLILKYDGLTSVTKNNNTVSDFSLSQNYPNPFNPSTIIRYQIPSAGNVKLKICNSIGQQVRCLVDAVKPAGENSVEFNASGLPSGAYFYRIESGSYSETKKMLLIK